MMARLGDRQSTFRFMGYERTGLWADVLGLPDALATTLEAADGLADAVGLLRAPGVERVVATGNGAAYYVAHGLWLASLEGNGGAAAHRHPLRAGGPTDLSLEAWRRRARRLLLG